MNYYMVIVMTSDTNGVPEYVQSLSNTKFCLDFQKYSRPTVNLPFNDPSELKFGKQSTCLECVPKILVNYPLEDCKLKTLIQVCCRN
jgi:hypothetical protein